MPWLQVWHPMAAVGQQGSRHDSLVCIFACWRNRLLLFFFLLTCHHNHHKLVFPWPIGRLSVLQHWCLGFKTRESCSRVSPPVCFLLRDWLIWARKCLFVGTGLGVGQGCGILGFCHGFLVVLLVHDGLIASRSGSRGSSSEASCQVFCFFVLGGRPNFLEPPKHWKKQTDDKQTRANILAR